MPRPAIGVEDWEAQATRIAAVTGRQTEAERVAAPAVAKVARVEDAWAEVMTGEGMTGAVWGEERQVQARARAEEARAEGTWAVVVTEEVAWAVVLEEERAEQGSEEGG